MSPLEMIAPARPTIGAFLLLDGLYHWTTLNGVLDARSDQASIIVYASPSPEVYDQLNAEGVATTYLLKPEQLAGMIFHFAQPGLQHYARDLHRRHYPVWLVARRVEDLPSVICNNRKAVRRTVAGLIERGHQRIAFLAGPAENLSANDRLEGYRQALLEAQIPFNPSLIGLGGYSESEARASVATLLQYHRPTAIIAANDSGAIGALLAAQGAGVAVPEDLEIIGFDDILRTRWTSPPLSTHHFDRFQMAFVATTELFRRINGEPFRLAVEIDTDQVMRGTTRNLQGPSHSKTERSQGAFFCDTQFAELKKNPEFAELVRQLESEELKHEEFLALFARAIHQIEQVDRDVTLLFPWLDRLFTRFLSTLAETTVRAARDRLSESAFNQQLRQREEALEFASVTGALRELAFKTVDEETVLATFARVLRHLAVSRAGIFLLPARGNAPGEWHRWDGGDAATLGPPTLIFSQDFDLPQLLNQGPAAGWLVMPILYNEQSFGLVVLESKSTFLQHFPELVRNFSAALHGARMFAALTRINQDRCIAQAAAEKLAADLAKSNEALSASEYFYHSLVESLPQGILRKDNEGRFNYVNSTFARLFHQPPDALLGSTDTRLYTPAVAAKYRAEELEMLRTGRPFEDEQTLVEDGGGRRYLHVKKTPLRDSAGAPIGLQILYWDITHFRETEDLLRKAQQDLMEASRLAGIAEIATAVLHNIGNALNGVTTSSGLIVQKLHDLRLEGLFKLAELLSSQNNIADFMVRDPRGVAVPKYLQQLALSLKEEQRSLLDETRALQHNVTRAAEIVAAQQSHAIAAGVMEPISPRELVECALRLCASSLEREGVQVVRQYHPAGAVMVKRHQALQIITQLVKNAIEAMESSPPDRRKLTVAVIPVLQSMIEIDVKDQGVGIPSENLDRIFQYGFTTKKPGRGFSLHTSALSAQEMEGKLTASNNVDTPGATFRLTLPSEVR